MRPKGRSSDPARSRPRRVCDTSVTAGFRPAHSSSRHMTTWPRELAPGRVPVKRGFVHLIHPELPRGTRFSPTFPSGVWSTFFAARSSSAPGQSCRIRRRLWGPLPQQNASRPFSTDERMRRVPGKRRIQSDTLAWKARLLVDVGRVGTPSCSAQLTTR
jgi:hypothetical protein